jgi:hypothetical protein
VSAETDRLVELGAGEVMLAPGVVDMLREAAGVRVPEGPPPVFEATVEEVLDHGVVVDYRFVHQGRALTYWARAFVAWTAVGAIALKAPAGGAERSGAVIRPLK